MMLLEVLTFLTNHRTIIIGATTTLTEVVIIFVNMRRKLRKDTQAASIINHRIDQRTYITRIISRKYLLWSANPINLFRKL